MIKRICIGGPLDGDIAFIEPAHRFTAVFMLNGFARESHEYRLIGVLPSGALDVAVFAHKDVSDEYAAAQACIAAGIEHPA